MIVPDKKINSRTTIQNENNMVIKQKQTKKTIFRLCILKPNKDINESYSENFPQKKTTLCKDKLAFYLILTYLFRLRLSLKYFMLI